MSYDYQSAINSGVSPETIANFLAKQQNFDVDGAVKAGADIKDVMVFLSTKAEQDPVTKAPVATPEPKGTASIASKVATPDVESNATFKATGDEGIIGGTAKALGNVPSSTFALGKSLFEMLNHPIDTVKNVANTVKGLGGKAGEVLLNHTGVGQKILELANATRIQNGQPELKKDANGKFTTEGITTPEIDQVNAIGDALKQRYGSLDAVKKSLIEDPVGVAFDVSSVLTGGEGLLKKAGEVSAKVGAVSTASKLAKASEVVGRGAELTNPLTQIPAVAKTAYTKVAGKVGLSNSIPENVSKVLTNTGKVNLSDVATGKKIENATNAFETIRQNAPNIKVKDIDGIEKTFDPAKANYYELPQALKQTKDAVYNEYSNIAKSAGDAGLEFSKADFAELNKTLEKYQGKGYTTAFANKARSLQEDLAKFKGKATPEEVQNLIEQVNLDVNPLSDKAGSQVATEFSRALRDKLDSKLEASGNPKYQATRTKYSQLKSIENDVLNRFKKSLREAGAKPDMIDHLTSMDALYGVLSGNLAHTATGLGFKMAKAKFNQIFGSEASLRKTFKLLEKESAVATPAEVVKEATVTKPIKAEKPLSPVKGRKKGVLQRELRARARQAGVK